MEIQSLNESFIISGWLYTSSLRAQMLLHKTKILTEKSL